MANAGTDTTSELEDKSRQLETASRHKSEFLANMSHELRTPLNAILGFNEMILGQIYGDVPAGMKEPLTDIQDSGKHLLRLINNVLDLSKIEAGRMELARGLLGPGCRGTRARLAPPAGRGQRAGVHGHGPRRPPDGVRRWRANHPVPHEPRGKRLEVHSAGARRDLGRPSGRPPVYHVADTGIGIPTDKIESLFTEFRQGDATIASEFGGTGLGLSITKKFVEMPRGRIWVESEVGKGSTSYFSVPLRLDGGKTA